MSYDSPYYKYNLNMGGGKQIFIPPFHSQTYECLRMPFTSQFYLRLKRDKTNSCSFEKESEKEKFWDATNWIHIFEYGLIYFILAILVYIIFFSNPFKSILTNCTLKPSLTHTDIELPTNFNPRHNKQKHSYDIIDPIEVLC